MSLKNISVFLVNNKICNLPLPPPRSQRISDSHFLQSYRMRTKVCRLRVMPDVLGDVLPSYSPPKSKCVQEQMSCFYSAHFKGKLGILFPDMLIVQRSFPGRVSRKRLTDR